jgi:lipopolysaccharide/colanic/teichoic acid biosynthesis glycosyltransferase
MEPDILATPSDPLAREPEWSARLEPPTAALPAESLSVSITPAFDPATPPRHAPGHTNGHGTNGNGSHGRGTNGRALNGHGPDSALLESQRWVTLSANGDVAALPASVAHLTLPRDRGLYLRAGKRMFDLIGALVALVLSAPVLLLAALAIKLESRGPVFYKSTRIGRGGRPFTFYKLRSMVNGADRHRHHLTHLNEADGPVFKICNDPRVTRVGRFLRSSSIDEIPQFFHVLSGDMSMVGPRPPIPEEVGQYEPWQMRRLDVRPGLTCLWQVSGRSRIGFQEWMRLDLEYIRRQSILLDLQILLRTVPAVLSREGAY